MIKAKPILKNKFWIIENNGQRIGTLSKQEDKRYMYSCATGTEYFSDTKSFNSYIGGVSWDKTSISDADSVTKEIHGFSTSTKPHNVIYNVQKKLPLFTCIFPKSVFPMCLFWGSGVGWESFVCTILWPIWKY